MRDYLKVTYRHIAKMFASALPVEGEEFGFKVETYLDTIKAMPAEDKTALRVAYIFSRKVPKEEREDLFQDIALAVFKAHTKEEKLAYAIARCDWRDWWKHYKIRQHVSLESIVTYDEGNPVTLSEVLVGEVEFEHKMDGKIEADRIWDMLPVHIKPVVLKRLIGKALNNSERGLLFRYVKSEGYKLIIA